MAIDLREVERMKKFAEVGEKVLDLFKEAGIVPKRTKRRVVYRVERKIIIRKPRGPNKAKVEDVPAAVE